MKKQSFSGIIEAGNMGGTGISIPFNVKEEFGSARAKVKVTIDKFTYRTTTAVMGGRTFIGVRKEIREAIGKDIGDRVKIVMIPDTEERIVELPSDFGKLLKKNKAAEEIFNKLAYTHRKEYVQWIESAKKQETRDTRLVKAIEMISNGKKIS